MTTRLCGPDVALSGANRFRHAGRTQAVQMAAVVALVGLLVCLTARPVLAQEPTAVEMKLSDLDQRLEEMERVNADLRAENSRLTNGIGAKQEDSDSAEVPDSDSTAAQPLVAPWRPRYDRGFILLDPDAVDGQPFQIKFNVTSQFRYTGFAPSANTWTDSAGVTQPIKPRSDFELNRNYVQVSGFGFDPKLQYTAIIFGSTAAGATFYTGWVNYEFSKAFNLHAGYWKLPGSREWYDSYTTTLGVDRTMATTFFRPNVTPGIWARGEPVDGLYYVAMFGNAFDSTRLNANRVGTNMSFSGTVWWEPLGTFGPGFSDLEFHEEPAIRTGTSFTYGRDNRQSDLTQTYPENTVTRLSDGTPLFETGALAPGVTVEKATNYLSAIDASWKWRGLSLAGEYYLRWLNDFLSNGALPVGSLFDHGGYAQGGFFLVPKKVEVFGRSSYVTGQFGTGSEYAGGVNWFIYGNRNVRATFDVTRVNHSPADNILTGFRAGDSGTLFQVQLVTVF